MVYILCIVCGESRITFSAMENQISVLTVVFPLGQWTSNRTEVRILQNHEAEIVEMVFNLLRFFRVKMTLMLVGMVYEFLSVGNVRRDVRSKLVPELRTSV